MADPFDFTKITGAAALPTGVSQSSMLRAQLNRYAALFTPSAFKFFTSKLDTTGPIDGSVSVRAGVVLSNRLTAQAATNSDVNPSSLLTPEATIVGGLLADFDGTYAQANADQIIGIVSGYADANNLPAAVMPGEIDIMSIPVIVGSIAAIAAGIGGYIWWSKKKAISGPA